MKVIILDRHPSNDARLSRHMKTLMGNNIPFSRYRLPRHDEIGYEGVPEKNHHFIKTVLNFKSIILFQLFQRIACLFPALLLDCGCAKDENDPERLIIHVHDPELLSLAKNLKMKKRPNAIIIYDRHEIFESAGGVYGRLARLYEIINKKKVDGVVGISAHYRDSNQRLFPRSIVYDVPNYPIRSDYDSAKISKKISSFLSSEETVLSYVGSLNNNYDRDINLLLDVFTKALHKFVNVRAVIAGNSPTEDLKERLRNLEIEFSGRFEYRGFVTRTEAVRIAEDSHIGFFLIRPRSKYWVKSSPNKLFEYFSSGVIPVIRADIDAEIGSESALIFDRDATEERIINEVVDLIDDKTRMRNMMESSYEMANSYSYEGVQNRYVDLYSRLLDDE